MCTYFVLLLLNLAVVTEDKITATVITLLILFSSCIQPSARASNSSTSYSNRPSAVLKQHAPTDAASSFLLGAVFGLGHATFEVARGEGARLKSTSNANTPHIISGIHSNLFFKQEASLTSLRHSENKDINPFQNTHILTAAQLCHHYKMESILFVHFADMHSQCFTLMVTSESLPFFTIKHRECDHMC